MQLIRSMFICSLFLALIVGCRNDNQPQPASPTGGGEATKEIPAAKSESVQPAAAPAQTQSPPQPGRMLPDPMRGKVQETVNSGGYTYVRLATEQGDVWAAARQLTVAVGDEVELAGLMPMYNFHSPTLDRTFDEILFVGSARVIGANAATGPVPPQPGAATPAMPDGHPPIGTAAAPAKSGPSTPRTPGKIEKLPDGLTVAELFARKADLQGQPVRFRGLVVKANRGIMSRNWLHIQDGTGTSGSNDITVTSADGYAPPGSIVVVAGTLNLDQDFGAGYVYAVIVEDATVTLEPPQPTPAQPDAGEPEQPGAAPDEAADKPEKPAPGDDNP
ncbi:MAG: nucleotide-binding protein [Planctomycetota bacterium]